MQGLWSAHRKNKLNLNSLPLPTAPAPAAADESLNTNEPVPSTSGLSTPSAEQTLHNGGLSTPSTATINPNQVAEVTDDIPAPAQNGIGAKRKLRTSRTTTSSGAEGGSSTKRSKYSSSTTGTSASSSSNAIAKDHAPPSARLSDLGGVEGCVEKMLELVAMPLCHPEVYLHTGVQPPRGVLLHGPPGCGKTLLAHAMAGHFSTFHCLWNVRESEKTLRDTFEEAKRVAPCLLFIDEIDAITPKRESAQREMERRIVAQFLTCMDDMSWEKNDNKPIIVIGATNRPDSLDPALRRAGRFDHEISMGVPDDEARAKILKVLCSKLRLEGDFNFTALAKATPGYVGADLTALTGAAGIIAVKRIFKQLSEGTLTLPDDPTLPLPLVPPPGEDQDVSMAVDIDPTISPAPVQPSSTSDTSSSSVPNPTPLSNPASTSTSIFSTLASYVLPHSIAHFLISHPNPLTPSQLAPICITSSDFHTALSQIQPSSKREGFATVPDVTWSDVGALHGVREELQMAIVQPIRRPEIFASVGIEAPCGVLMWGPPGCGKTLLAKAVANESRANFMSVKGPELLNKYVGESERAVRQVFSRARASAPCVIFFDELDALVPRRDDNLSESSARVVNTLLTELDGLDSRKGVYVIAATNRPDMIDPAMVRPGRLDKLLYVDLPSKDELREILRTLMRRVPLGGRWGGSTLTGQSAEAEAEEVRQEVEKIIMERCVGYSGADLAALVREAGVVALKRTLGALDQMSEAGIGSNPNVLEPPMPVVLVGVDDFLGALDKVGPSVSTAQRRKYQNLRNKFAGGLPVSAKEKKGGKMDAEDAEDDGEPDRKGGEDNMAAT
ncbi:P-loop containing nucleoside triphosphate hydrolase protein [Gymnopilus junonius]|uniref:P-loop containing nucleoside triphosphate hydrolase protein n=1 Tax=Gymnopilus junonius TaxID=109634 RepID=A0A9P5NRB3_GYMJU|nr:P-loop containing nucleoside triphosphate hydrolase protein [Gymnopilus junonius]